MLATARLTGQTFGAILAAISFQIAEHSETVALAVSGRPRGDRRDRQRRSDLSSGTFASAKNGNGS